MHALAPLDPVLIRALELKPGNRVVDLGCGSGEPTLSIARWIEPRGEVLGLDIEPSMLREARRRARYFGIKNVRFRLGDLTRFRHRGPRVDAAVSRCGLMFADDVPRALGAIRSCLKPGGRAAFAVWGPIGRNPAHALRTQAALPFMDEPPPAHDAGPHPLRLERAGLLPRLMRQAAFRRVRTEAVPVCWAFPTVDDYVRAQTETVLADLYFKLSPVERQKLRERLRKKFRRFEAKDGLRVPGAAWVVSGIA